jgi:hypothetical protein
MDRSIEDPPNVGDVARQAVSDVVDAAHDNFTVHPKKSAAVRCHRCVRRLHSRTDCAVGLERGRSRSGQRAEHRACEVAPRLEVSSTWKWRSVVWEPILDCGFDPILPRSALVPGATQAQRQQRPLGFSLEQNAPPNRYPSLVP